MPADTTVYFHADCLDGFGAAWAAWRRFGDAARYIPMHYGLAWQPGDVAGRDVFVLDFSFPPDELTAMARLARSVHQLDHHASARDAWQARLTAGAGGRAEFEDAGLALRVSFDMDKSGARLAWEHFHPGQDVPRAIAHIEDQDLWRFRLDGTRAFCRALRLRPFEFAAWDEIARAADGADDAPYRALRTEGEAIERFMTVEVERLAASALVMPAVLNVAAHEGDPAGLAVAGLAVNANMLFASELGHRLALQSGSFGLVWQLAADGEVKASLRACGRVDVAALAARLGGGGHPNAAGFRMPWAKFAREVLACPDPG
jgi:oligoribonuclease NrnB/cAMP/cGMP phosphodiesterase (DHH superfamily)